MNLLCPACGYSADADGFIAEIEQARALALALKAPAALAGPLMSYLRLFRPGERRLTARKVEKLLGELLPMIAAGRVERHGRQWIAPVDAWAAAMEELVSRRDRLTLPLTGHGYLLEMLAGSANRVEATAETGREQARQRGEHRPTETAPRDYRPVVRPQGIPTHIREQLVQSGMLKDTDSTPGDSHE